MFAQIIQGPVHDRAGYRRALLRWMDDLAPRAEGWLGTTAGIADDGRSVAIARFASAEAARHNSDRGDQGAWWEEFTKTFDEPPIVDDCSDVGLWLGGGSDDAGFVQVIATPVSDPAHLRQLMPRLSALDADAMDRPDVIGGIFAIADDGSVAMNVVYFTTEEAARAGEARMQDTPADDLWDELLATVGEPRYTDLRDPMLMSP